MACCATNIFLLYGGIIFTLSGLLKEVIGLKSDIDFLKLIETDTKRVYNYWIMKAGLRLFKKKSLPSKKIPITDYNPYFPCALDLKCGCNYYWMERTKQTILYPSNECQENHRAEIAENVSKEDWENLLKVNDTLGPKNTYHRGFIGSSGVISHPPQINNQGGNTP